MGTFRARDTRKQHGKSRAGSRERRDHTEGIRIAANAGATQASSPVGSTPKQCMSNLQLAIQDAIQDEGAFVAEFMLPHNGLMNSRPDYLLFTAEN